MYIYCVYICIYIGCTHIVYIYVCVHVTVPRYGAYDTASYPPIPPASPKRPQTPPHQELGPNLWELTLERCVDFGHTFSKIIEMLPGVDIMHGEAVNVDGASLFRSCSCIFICRAGASALVCLCAHTQFDHRHPNKNGTKTMQASSASCSPAAGALSPQASATGSSPP